METKYSDFLRDLDKQVPKLTFSMGQVFTNVPKVYGANHLHRDLVWVYSSARNLPNSKEVASASPPYQGREARLSSILKFVAPFPAKNQSKKQSR